MKTVLGTASRLRSTPFSTLLTPPVQRSAVKQRPHQETASCPVATSAPWYFTTGDREDGAGHDEVRPSVFNGLLDGLGLNLVGVSDGEFLQECGQSAFVQESCSN
jgi:hypothetical protein